ncbi:13883_t:CDS:2, partial [Acaulospora morrowiae]
KDLNWMTDSVQSGLVYVRHNNQVLFWTLDFKSSYREYEVISGNHYMAWVEDRKKKRIRIMEDAIQRDQASAAAEEEKNKQTGASADTTTNIAATVSALGVDVDPRQFALSQIRITGTRSSVSSAVSALQHFAPWKNFDLIVMNGN